MPRKYVDPEDDFDDDWEPSADEIDWDDKEDSPEPPEVPEKEE